MSTLTSTSTVEDSIEIQILNRRERFALFYTRALTWGLGVFAVGIVGLWLVFHQYTQLLVLAGLLGIVYSGHGAVSSFLPKGSICSRRLYCTGFAAARPRLQRLPRPKSDAGGRVDVCRHPVAGYAVSGQRRLSALHHRDRLPGGCGGHPDAGCQPCVVHATE